MADKISKNKRALNFFWLFKSSIQNRMSFFVDMIFMTIKGGRKRIGFFS